MKNTDTKIIEMFKTFQEQHIQRYRIGKISSTMFITSSGKSSGFRLYKSEESLRNNATSFYARYYQSFRKNIAIAFEDDSYFHIFENRVSYTRRFSDNDDHTIEDSSDYFNLALEYNIKLEFSTIEYLQNRVKTLNTDYLFMIYGDEL